MSLPKHPKISPVHRLVAGAALVAGFAVVLKSMHMAYLGQLSPLKSIGVKVNVETMKTFSDKLEFASKYWTAGLVWLYFYVHVVILRRFTSGALVPNTNIEYQVADQRSILTNSIEQFLMTVVAQVAVLGYLTPVQVTNIIPLVNGFYLVGRITFWLGYPKLRTLGMILTMAPCSVMIWFLSYQFYKTHNLAALVGLK